MQHMHGTITDCKTSHSKRFDTSTKYYPPQKFQRFQYLSSYEMTENNFQNGHILFNYTVKVLHV